MTTILILSLASLALSAAVRTSSTPTLVPATAVPTPFVSSTMSQCIRFCVADAANTKHCNDPKFQQAVSACLQSKCSFTEQEVALHIQHGTKCQRGSESVIPIYPPVDIPSSHVVHNLVGPDHGFPTNAALPSATSSPCPGSSSSPSPKVSSSFLISPSPSPSSSPSPSPGPSPNPSLKVSSSFLISPSPSPSPSPNPSLKVSSSFLISPSPSPNPSLKVSSSILNSPSPSQSSHSNMSLRLEVGSGFVVAALVNILWAI